MIYPKNQPREMWEKKFDKCGFTDSKEAGEHIKDFIHQTRKEVAEEVCGKIRHDLTKIFEKYMIEPMTGRVVMLELDVYFDTFSNKKHEED